MRVSGIRQKRCHPTDKKRRQIKNEQIKKATLDIVAAVDLNMLARTEGGAAGRRSSFLRPHGGDSSIQRASASGRHPAADHCGPLPRTLHPPTHTPTLVLVISLWRRGRYLFLHQPQLVAQVVVGFQQVLDLGFGHGQFVLHLDVLLHGDGAVGEVRVQALRRRRWVEIVTAHGQARVEKKKKKKK